MAKPARRDPASIPGIVTADAIEPLLTLDGVARILSVSRSSIERMKSAGNLPRPDLRIGRMPRWRPATINRWIDGQSARKGGG